MSGPLPIPVGSPALPRSFRELLFILRTWRATGVVPVAHIVCDVEDEEVADCACAA